MARKIILMVKKRTRPASEKEIRRAIVGYLGELIRVTQVPEGALHSIVTTASQMRDYLRLKNPIAGSDNMFRIFASEKEVLSALEWIAQRGEIRRKIPDKGSVLFRLRKRDESGDAFVLSYGVVA